MSYWNMQIAIVIYKFFCFWSGAVVCDYDFEILVCLMQKALNR